MYKQDSALDNQEVLVYHKTLATYIFELKFHAYRYNEIEKQIIS